MVARLLVGCLRWLAPVSLAFWLAVLAPLAFAADLAEITQLYRTGQYAECVDAGFCVSAAGVSGAPPGMST